jgi:hypothetical protein
MTFHILVVVVYFQFASASKDIITVIGTKVSFLSLFE